MPRAVERLGGWAVVAVGIGVAVAGILLVVQALGGKREAIARAEAEAAGMQRQRDSLVAVVTEREREAAALEHERAITEAAASRLRDSVQSLERRRAASQLDVRRIRTVGALQDRLRGAFPDLGGSAWGLTTVPLPGDTLGLTYLMLPAWFAETFIIDRANARSWREQKDRLLAVDSLQLLVSALQDSVTTLVAANAAAYQTGYRVAYAGYRDLSRRYVAELEKPRIDIPGPIGLLGAAAVGLVVGSVIR